jgi:hypothetical protein
LLEYSNCILHMRLMLKYPNKEGIGEHPNKMAIICSGSKL